MKITTYTLTELGSLYFPSSTARSASGQLKRWIRINRQLTDELRQAGYQTGQRYLTPLQVSLIIQHLGEP